MPSPTSCWGAVLPSSTHPHLQLFMQHTMLLAHKCSTLISAFIKKIPIYYHYQNSHHVSALVSSSRSRAPFVASWWLTAGVVVLPSLSARWPNLFSSLTYFGLTTTFQVVSGLACVVCGLLQGVQDPALQTLQVKKTRKSHNYSSFLSCACLSWASLGLPSPSSSSTCTLPNSSPPPWGTRRLESAPWLPGCSSSSPWCSWYNPQLN